MAAELRFRAMGSDAHLIVNGGPDHLLGAARARIEQLERRWSRFLGDSEISEINRHAGSFVTVSTDTVTLVQRSLEAWKISAGAFDPTILGAVIRAGYDRSFELLGPSPVTGRSFLDIDARHIVVNGNAVRLPERTGFDPGGIGKGLAADLVCAETLTAGADGVCVNLGGDIRAAGTGPDGGAWTVGVLHPSAVKPILLLGIAQGAVATSTTLRRQWDTKEGPRHHIIDPQTGQPSGSDITLAAVVAADAWLAEVLAKAVILAGSEHPFDLLGGMAAQAVAVDDRGFVHTTAGLRDYLGGAAAPDRLPLTGLAADPQQRQ